LPPVKPIAIISKHKVAKIFAVVSNRIPTGLIF